MSVPVPDIPSDMLKIGAELLAKKGYAATTTREISRELRIQKSTLYHYLSGKEDLLFAISLYSLDKIRERVTLEYTAASSESARFRLGRVINAHLEALLKDQAMHQSMLKELNLLTGDRRLEILRLRREYEDLFTRYISEAQSCGGIDNDTDSTLLMRIILGSLNWTAFWFSPNGPRTVREISTAMCKTFGVVL